MISDININNGSRRSMFQRIKNALKTHWLPLVCLGIPIVIESGVTLMHVAQDRFGRGAHVAVCCLLLTAIATAVSRASRWLPAEVVNDKAAMRLVAFFGAVFAMIVALFGTWGVYECVAHESYMALLVAGLVVFNLRLHTVAMQTLNNTSNTTTAITTKE